ncbi:MAG: YceI family protein [Acidobacteriota bacterium]|nr:YceI family protein [Acidobacteriota bacterium]
MIFAVFALGFISFDTSGEGLREKGFAAKFADTKLTAAETTGSYDIDAKHSYIGFRVTHMGLAEVPGAFRDFSGSINYDGKDVSKSSVNFTAKVTSVDTGVAPRDEHLRKADFFEVEKYPDMIFKSTKVEKKGDKWEVTGDFTLKGVTKQITIPFTVNGMMKDQKGNVKMGISAQTMINRQDYGVKYGNKLPDGTLALSDMVKIDLQLEAGMMKK